MKLEVNANVMDHDSNLKDAHTGKKANKTVNVLSTPQGMV